MPLGREGSLAVEEVALGREGSLAVEEVALGKEGSLAEEGTFGKEDSLAEIHTLLVQGDPACILNAVNLS